MVKPETELCRLTIRLLKERGVELIDIANLVTNLQKPYKKNISNETSLKYVEKVLRKREVQHAVLTGIQLDILAEEGLLKEPLQTIIEEDEALYGADESLAVAIVNVYGSIGLTNFGYLDKLKPGIIGKLDDQKNGGVNTFLDDLVGAIAAAAASSFAHSHPDDSELMH